LILSDAKVVGQKKKKKKKPFKHPYG